MPFDYNPEDDTTDRRRKERRSGSEEIKAIYADIHALKSAIKGDNKTFVQRWGGLLSIGFALVVYGVAFFISYGTMEHRVLTVEEKAKTLIPRKEVHLMIGSVENQIQNLSTRINNQSAVNESMYEHIVSQLKDLNDKFDRFVNISLTNKSKR